MPISDIINVIHPIIIEGTKIEESIQAKETPTAKASKLVAMASAIRVFAGIGNVIIEGLSDIESQIILLPTENRMPKATHFE